MNHFSAPDLHQLKVQRQVRANMRLQFPWIVDEPVANISSGDTGTHFEERYTEAIHRQAHPIPGGFGTRYTAPN